VVTDGDGERAARLAADFGRRVWELREQTHPTGLSIDGALDRAVAAPAGPVVLADMGDNAGVGAPSDSTFVLHRVLDRGIGDVLTGLYWDPVAVRFCQEAGEGAQLDLRIGGKVGPDSGDPVDLKVTVRRIVADARQSFGGSRAAMGDSVWVSAEGGLDIVLNSIRVQTFHPDAFSQLGLDPTAKRIVVVKSTQHFHAGFAPMAAEILYIAGPGAMPMDFANIDYRKFTAPFWPRVEDPFAGS
jgi:microcystin degradation protein MlrC